MKKFFKRTMSCVIVGAMLLLNLPKNSIVGAEDMLPAIPKTIFATKTDLDTTWSKNGDGTLENPGGTNQYILFGRYPQTEVTSSDADYAAASGATYTDGVSSDGRYATLSNKYFRIEPIKWRILSNSDGKLFLVSDSCIDANKPFLYNNNQPSSQNATWVESDLRKWLNSEIASGTSDADQLPEGTDLSSNTSLNGKYSNGFTNLITGKFGALGFLHSAFTTAQQDKISSETVPCSHVTNIGPNDFTYTTDILDGQKIFVLSGN